ncbi:hypothetical protein AUR04nite_09600 [Glutamicibacter uratoxydans]|uniref:Uncharacterized protein n=1 Tax=Glutamicibacter uratoxydans TaxID=43667 RepID=A0A4Y4DPY0_GLUUR|nr:hypothetical protein AUR04nite_09600 [Glutamicibacter uratoxydans]
MAHSEGLVPPQPAERGLHCFTALFHGPDSQPKFAALFQLGAQDLKALAVFGVIDLAAGVAFTQHPLGAGR